MSGSDQEHIQALNRLVLAQGQALSDLRQQTDCDRAFLREIADEVVKLRSERLEVRR